MKQTISILLLVTVLSYCSSSDQAEATGQAKKIQAAVEQNIPGTIATTENGYTMKAKIDGKIWAAGSMMPPEAAGRIIGYNKSEFIGLPYSKSDMVAGSKTTFGEDNAADFSTKNAKGLWSCRNGEMQITKVDANWVEGKFFFSGSYSGSNKTVAVTDGFFRIPVANTKTP
jgi:hypothetical protein